MSHLIPYTFPVILRPFFFPAITRLKNEKKRLFLTFDDGPTPFITQEVLALLRDYEAFGTFFVIGEKVKKSPQLAIQIKTEGHTVGNHTWHHLNAFAVRKKKYLADISHTQSLLEKMGLNSQKWFRPPYGKITPSLLYQLKTKGYQTVLWTHLSMDFDPKRNTEKSLLILKKKIRPGDIIVFHDSQKAWPSLKKILPPLLEHIKLKKWHADSLIKYD